MNAWAMYDWSNSVYNLVITSTIFPIYYMVVTGGEGAEITFLGITLKNTTLYDFIIAFAYLLIVFIAPILSGIADYGGYKKKFMQGFTLLGSVSCATLYFFDSEHLYIGVIFSILACIGYSGSLVFYNSFLPEVATPDKQDKLSAKGFALGYLGSALLLIVNLFLIMSVPEEEGEKKLQIMQNAFLMVGVWWIIFSLYTFKYLPNNVYNKKPEGNKFLKGFQELRNVFADLRKTPNLKRFLFAFFIYNMGVQTIMLVANHFGSEEIISGYEIKVELKDETDVIRIADEGEFVKKGDLVCIINWDKGHPQLQHTDTIIAEEDVTVSYKNAHVTLFSTEKMIGSEEVKMQPGQLIKTILIIQFVAIAGAFLFSYLSRKKGNLFTLRIATVIWGLVCIATYLFVYKTTHFYIIAGIVGLIMGGIQALSRSTYSKMLPDTEDHASYFSFYDITEKISIVLGMALFGLMNEMSSGMRQPILILISFFIIGFLLLLRVKKHNHVE